MAQFEEFLDLGEIIIPEDYVSEKELGTLNSKEFINFAPAFRDENFIKPSTILKPGDRVAVKVFIQTDDEEVSHSHDWYYFLSGIPGNIYLGAHGVSLVYKHKRDLLPRGLFCYCSFDKKDNLWKDRIGFYRIPFLEVLNGKKYSIGLGKTAHTWDVKYLSLGFSLSFKI